MERDEYKSTNYELFILALSVLSIFNWLMHLLTLKEEVDEVVLLVDLVISFIFMADFIYRLKTAKSRSMYFLKQYGWLDLLGSIPLPQFRIARLGRVTRAVRLMKQFGVRNMLREFFGNPQGPLVPVKKRFFG